MGPFASLRRARLPVVAGVVVLALSAMTAAVIGPDPSEGPPPPTVGPVTTSTTSTTSTTTTTLAPNPVPPAGFVVGVVEPTPGDGLGAVDAFAAATDTTVGVVSIFTSFAQPFPADAIAAIRSRGATPMVTLEPWPTTPGVHCATDVGTCVLQGAFDDLVTQWAIAAADDGAPLLLRFAHEPNLKHYPWGVGKVAPETYVHMWRYVHALFAVAGANEVAWVWAFQAPGGPNPDPEPWWPGRDVVDWVGIDGYNGGTSLPWGGWSSFGSLFGAGFRAATRLAPHHPLMISETASATAGGSRPEWIARMADTLTDQRVCAFVWFEQDKEAAWSVHDDPASATALGAALRRAPACE